jgi:hypothetical protein
MEEAERKKILQSVLEENLTPSTTIAFLYKDRPEETKELIKTSIDNALLILYQKTEKPIEAEKFYLKNFEEFTDFYKENYYDKNEFPKALTPHLNDYLLHKISTGEMIPLFKKEVEKVEEDPNALIYRAFLTALTEETKKKLSRASEGGMDENLLSKIKTEVIRQLNENAEKLSKTPEYELKPDFLNFYFQTIIGRELHSSLTPKLNFNDRINEIRELNNKIKILSQVKEIKPKQEQQTQEPTKRQFDLSQIGVEAEQPFELHKIEEKEKPSITMFLKKFFETKINKTGAVVATKIKKDLTDEKGNKVEGKKLYELAKNFTEEYANAYDLKNLERNPMLLKKDETKKSLLVNDHTKIKKIIDTLKTRNPQNTKPEELERYNYILLALNLLHSRLSEVTTPFMKAQFTAT